MTFSCLSVTHLRKQIIGRFPFCLKQLTVSITFIGKCVQKFNYIMEPSVILDDHCTKRHVVSCSKVFQVLKIPWIARTRLVRINYQCLIFSWKSLTISLSLFPALYCTARSPLHKALTSQLVHHSTKRWPAMKTFCIVSWNWSFMAADVQIKQL